MSHAKDRKTARSLVLFAIHRIQEAQRAWKEVESNPTCDSDDRGAAREHLRACELEFHHQWENVLFVLIPSTGEPHALPKTVELTGSDPEFTGDLSTDEYIRQIRGRDAT